MPARHRDIGGTLRLTAGALALALFLPPPSGAAELTDGGPEYQLNIVTAGEQGYPKIARRGGGFVVVWESYGADGAGNGVFGRLLDSAGGPMGTEFQVNTYTTGAQDTPSVGSDASGNFVVVWESFGQDGSTDGVFGRRFMVDGSPIGGEFQINALTVNSQDDPRVAVDFTGEFVVTWESFNQDGSAASIVVQRYSSSGAKIGTEQVVNTFTAGAQLDPDVSIDAVGNFVVVWASLNQDGSQTGIFGQRYSSAGTPQGTEFQVNTFTTGAQDEATVAIDDVGNVVVVWESNGQDGSANGVFAQRFNSVGARVGSEFRVNTVSNYSQDDASVEADPAGGFVVAWESLGQDGSQNNGVFVRSFDAAGAPVGVDVQVNLTTEGSQDDADIVLTADGRAAVVWNGFAQDGDAGSVIGRHFGGVTTTTLPQSLCEPQPGSACKTGEAGRSKLLLRSATSGDARLLWKMLRAEATALDEFLDPPNSSETSYHLCLYDAGEAPQPLIGMDIPAAGSCGDSPCWHMVGEDTYRYRDREATHDGVVRARVKSGAAGTARVMAMAMAKGARFVPPSMPLEFPVVVELVVSDGTSTSCWQSRFTAPVDNTTSELRALGP